MGEHQNKCCTSCGGRNGLTVLDAVGDDGAGAAGAGGGVDVELLLLEDDEGG
jgi:hypothetical protein